MILKPKILSKKTEGKKERKDGREGGRKERRKGKKEGRKLQIFLLHTDTKIQTKL